MTHGDNPGGVTSKNVPWNLSNNGATEFREKLRKQPNLTHFYHTANGSPMLALFTRSCFLSFFSLFYWNACVYSRLPSLWVYLPLHIVFPRTSGQALMSPLPWVSPHPLGHNAKQASLFNNRPLRLHFQSLTDQEKCNHLRIPNEDIKCLMGLLYAWLPTIALTNEIH